MSLILFKVCYNIRQHIVQLVWHYGYKAYPGEYIILEDTLL